MLFDLSMFLKLMRLTFSRKYFRVRLVLHLIFWMFIYMSAEVLIAIGRALDHVFFRGYKKVKPQAPVFIVGNPRSGTTHFHRLMSMDGERFTTLKLWQSILPSVSLYRLVFALTRVDKLIFRPFGRFFGLMERLFMGGWDEIHRMGFWEPEEDEAYWFLKLYTPAVHMLFPFFDELTDCQWPDRMSEERRAKLSDYYFDNIQRHIYATGEDRIFLNKSVFAAGRLGTALARFPDAKVVYLVRDPYKAIPSAVSMFEMTWSVASPQLAGDSVASRAFAQLMIDYYQRYLEMARTYPADRFVTVMYDDLIKDAKSTVTAVYSQLGLTVSEEFASSLAVEMERHRDYKSKHQYALDDFGLTEEFVNTQLLEAFEVYGFAR